MAEKTLDPIFLGRIATFATSIGNLASNEADRKRLRHSIFVDFFQPLIASIRVGNSLVAELAQEFRVVTSDRRKTLCCVAESLRGFRYKQPAASATLCALNLS